MICAGSFDDNVRQAEREPNNPTRDNLMRISNHGRLAAVFIAILFSSSPTRAQDNKEQVLQTFTLREVFGVSHPEQIIDFHLAVKIDPSSSYMIGPDGKETPLSGVAGGEDRRARQLAGEQNWTWKLLGGKAPTLLPAA